MKEDLIDLGEFAKSEIFNLAIVEELLREIDSSITEDDIQKIWKLCDGNPWNAAILYKMLTMMG